LQIRLEYLGEEGEDLETEGGQGHGFILAAREGVGKVLIAVHIWTGELQNTNEIDKVYQK
jgi:hypothetical protein